MPLNSTMLLASQAGLPRPREEDAFGIKAQTAAQGSAGVVLVLLQIPLVVMIGLLDHWSRHQLSLALLYQVPVALAAWRGGFACGILLSLGACTCWHVVDLLGGRDPELAISVWNGVVRFGIFTMTSSLLTRLRLSLFHERNLARTDPLTGAANGRTFYESVCGAVEHSLRNSEPLTLVYLDLDDFKKVNDQYGHSLGDEMLRRVTAIIHRNLRAVDVLARLGGDEFALLLPGAGKDEAHALITRLHRLLSQEKVGKDHSITVSIGAATFLHPNRDIDLMVRRADALMYRAKHGGKNRFEHEIVHHSDGGKSTKMERRAVARILCSRTVRIRPEGSNEVVDENARVVDISSHGIGLCLQDSIPVETLVAIEPLYECGATALLARIVWAVREGENWIYGCTLATALGSDELRRWLGAQYQEELEPLETIT